MWKVTWLKSLGYAFVLGAVASLSGCATDQIAMATCKNSHDLSIALEADAGRYRLVQKMGDKQVDSLNVQKHDCVNWTWNSNDFQQIYISFTGDDKGKGKPTKTPVELNVLQSDYGETTITAQIVKGPKENKSDNEYKFAIIGIPTAMPTDGLQGTAYFYDPYFIVN